MTPVKPKVLFLDDDFLLLKAVEVITRNSEFTFRLTSSVKEAMQLIKSEGYQVIFSDFHMPECNGVEFLAEVAKICPKSVRILVSASLQDQEAKASLRQQHIFTFLKKPFCKDSFDESLHSALREWERTSST
jgi:DNA-binding NtrC family response regulator